MQKIKRLSDFVLKYGILAWMSAAVVWYLIVSTLHHGISCDEGYYLLGYLSNQIIGGQASDFHAIVRAICRPFPDDDIMVFRYVRLVLNVIAMMFFALTSYSWLSRKNKLGVSRWAYYPMAALACAMSFTFAAPTISYDSLEVIITLLATSLLFVQFVSERGWVRHLAAIGVGFFLWFAFTNYPPAGVCLTILFVALYWLESDKEKWQGMLFALLGLVLALIINHLFINDLRQWFSEMTQIVVATFMETSKSRHDSGSLVSGMLQTAGKLLLIMVPTVVVLTLAFRKIRLPKWLLLGIVIVLCSVLLVVRKVYNLHGSLFVFPLAFMLAHVLSSPKVRIGKFLISKEMWVILIFLSIPLAGVFGTNQAIMNKAVIFTPFWLTAFYLLMAQSNQESDGRLALVYMVMLFAGYIYMGNFQRYHYYYTPRSSKYELIGVLRQQKVLVSQYQQAYFQDVLDSLQSAGCKAGDLYMAFGENQMTVYLAGGYVDGRLPYHWWQYTVFERESPKAFVLFKNDDDGVLGHFSQAGWDFPEAYRRIEMRQMSENMGDELQTVIYVRKENMK